MFSKIKSFLLVLALTTIPITIGSYLCLDSVAFAVLKNLPVKPGKSSAGGRVGAGSRTPCLPSDNARLVALVPEESNPNDEDKKYAFGETKSNQPTLFIYVPYGAGTPVEFALQGSDERDIKSFRFTLKGSGIIRINLRGLKAEKHGRYFLWHFNIQCNENKETPDFVSAWVEIQAQTSSEGWYDKLERLAPKENSRQFGLKSLLSDLNFRDPQSSNDLIDITDITNASVIDTKNFDF